MPVEENPAPHVAVYEGAENGSKALIILTKSNERYSVGLSLSLTCRAKERSTSSRLGREAKGEEDIRVKVNGESSYIGQCDGWRIYICPDGGVNGDYMTGRKDLPAGMQYEVLSEELWLKIQCEDGSAFLPFIVKRMDYLMHGYGCGGSSLDYVDKGPDGERSE